MTTTAKQGTTTRGRAEGVSQRADRQRRHVRRVSAPVRAAGSPQRSALLRLPFVIALIAVLGMGVSGVLYFNTKTDEVGIRTEQARSASDQLRLQIEALNRHIARLRSTPHLAERARALGMVPAGDAAIIQLDQPESDGAAGTANSDATGGAGDQADGDSGAGDSAGGDTSGDQADHDDAADGSGDTEKRKHLDGGTLIGTPHAVTGGHGTDDGAGQ